MLPKWYKIIRLPSGRYRLVFADGLYDKNASNRGAITLFDNLSHADGMGMLKKLKHFMEQKNEN